MSPDHRLAAVPVEYYHYYVNGSSSTASQASIDTTTTSNDTVEPMQETVENGITVPRMKLKSLKLSNRAHFNALMEKHSFVVLTDLGDSLEDKYARLMDAFQEFFTSTDTEWQQSCTSKQIYKNENGTPMWYCGYEHTHVRDCFRVHCGDMSRLVWPNDEFQERWLSLLTAMQQICDQALRLTLGYSVDPPSKRSREDDFSVCYGLHYPNTETSGQSEEENVFEHVDPSLYVVEPVCDVEGLDVFDQASQQWIQAEKVCHPGKEIILFCGKALERATNNRIPGTLHRVSRADRRRFCVIYEQKYAEFF